MKLEWAPTILIFGKIWVSCFVDNSAGYSAEMKEGLGFFKFFYGKVLWSPCIEW